MRKNNRTCVLCGSKYTYCPTCSDYANYPRWMGLFHDENCKKIFYTVNGYLEKAIPLKEAKEILQKCDLSVKDKTSSIFANHIDEILNSEKKETKSEKKVETEKKTVIKETVKEEK